jgi:5'-3' exonuclease
VRHNGKDLIVDANGLFAKSFYAAQASHLKYVDRGYLVAVFKSLFYAMRSEIGVPRRILFCFDGKPKTNKPRKPKPQEYERDLVDFARFVRDAFGDEAYAHHENYEADDLVATAVTQSTSQGIKSIVISGDKDLQQLRTSMVEYYCLNRKHLLTEKEICQRWDVHRPIQVAIALAIIGDPGDGINGVNKCGPSAVKKIFDGIPPDSSLEEVMDLVASKLGTVPQVDKKTGERFPSQQAQFLESLNYTLLNTEAEGNYEATNFIPNPNPDLEEGPVLEEYQRGIRMLDPDASSREVEDWNP